MIVEQGGSESLNISADDNLLPYLTSDVRGDTLELGIKPGASIQPSQNVVYRISVKSLRGFSLSGSGEVDLKNIDTDELSIEISGSGKITAAGRAGTQAVTISGSGDYLAEALESSAATLDISGAGEALVNASQRLDVTISGTGSVEYLGDPAVSQDVSGTGEVQKR